MVVTFFIGNGFDLNLGLKTRYSHFVELYSKPSDGQEDTIIRDFKNSIDRDRQTWADAEKAFGEYTEKFKSDNNGAYNYCKCHEDFCISLAEYLKKENARIDASIIQRKDILKKTAASFSNFYKGIKPVPQNNIANSISNIGGGYIFQFVSFNYTDTLDRLLDGIRQNNIGFGTRPTTNVNYSNKIGGLIHVHGTFNTGMVLGVNDKSQLAYPDLFDKAPPELIAQVIKPLTNQINEEQTEERTKQLVDASNLIYIYGMSIGETDKRWWEQICTMMFNRNSLHVIVHCYDAPNEGLLRTEVKTYERVFRERFMSFSKLNDDQKRTIQNRIHVVREDLFSGIRDIAKMDNTK